MASDSQRRPRSKSWVRGEPVTLTQNNCAGHNRVWTRPQLPGSGAAQTTAAQPVTVPWDVASIAAKQQLPHARATRQQQDVLPLPHARTGRTDASSARQGLQATDVPLGTVPIPNSASGSSFSQQYVRKRPNQLTLSGSQQPASQAGAAAWPRPFAPSSGVPPGGQPASMLVPHRQAAAAVPRFAGATHPRDGLQQQMAERAAALAGRSPTRMQLHSMASAPAAAAPGLMQPVASGARGPAAPTGCKTRQKAASKKWARPELAANSCTAGAGGSAAAGAAASTSARGGAPSQRKGLATASAAAVRTPSRAYRPVLPAWAARGSGPRSGSKAASSTPASHRQQHAGLRARRKARTWVRQDSQTSSIGTLLQPSAAVALLKHLRKGARTWHREAVNAAASEGAATPAATAQAMAAPPIRQTAQLTPHHLGRQPKRSRRAGNSQATVQRPAKLQRIDGQMYRVGGGKGRSRTLQRQPHTPAPAVSTPAQLLKQVLGLIARTTHTCPRICLMQRCKQRHCWSRSLTVFQASAGKAHLYSVRGKFRRTVVRRLSGTPGSPASLQGSAAARRKLRGSPFATRSGGIRKRTPVSRLSRQPRAKSAKLPPQIYCTEFCRSVCSCIWS
jgi:hypothetical protein